MINEASLIRSVREHVFHRVLEPIQSILQPSTRFNIPFMLFENVYTHTEQQMDFIIEESREQIA
jgi:hypothetical protein